MFLNRVRVDICVVMSSADRDGKKVKMVTQIKKCRVFDGWQVQGDVKLVMLA